MKYIVALLLDGEPELLTPMEKPVSVEGVIENEAEPEVADPDKSTTEPDIAAVPF